MSLSDNSLLVLGSSVALGTGSSLHLGWVTSFARTHGFTRTQNLAIGGTTTDSWLQILDQTDSLPNARLTVLSLSLANEGLASLRAEERTARRLVEGFVKRIGMLVERLVKKISGFSKTNDVESVGDKYPVLAVCGLYPNGDYGEGHWRLLLEARNAMRKDLDKIKGELPKAGLQILFVDFLDDEWQVSDGKGRWREGLEEDAGHPNDAGHRAMAKAFGGQWKKYLDATKSIIEVALFLLRFFL